MLATSHMLTGTATPVGLCEASQSPPAEGESECSLLYVFLTLMELPLLSDREDHNCCDPPFTWVAVVSRVLLLSALHLGSCSLLSVASAPSPGVRNKDLCLCSLFSELAFPAPSVTTAVVYKVFPKGP